LYVAPASNCSLPTVGDAADTITTAVNNAATVTVNVMILMVFIITQFPSLRKLMANPNPSEFTTEWLAD
jgi:hypothetical protein